MRLLRKIILLFPVILMVNVPVFGKNTLRLGNIVVNGDSGAANLPLYLTNNEGVAGFEFAIKDDAAAVRIDTVFVAGRANEFIAMHRNNKVILFSLTGTPVEAGEGKIADLIVTIDKGKIAGSDTVRFTSQTILSDQAGESIEDISTVPGVIFLDSMTGIAKNNNLIPKVYALEQNYPNPFNSSTILKYALPAAGEIELIIYNRLGQKVRILEEGYRNAGDHLSRWDGRNDSGQPVASGVYLCTFRVKEKNIILNRKMMYLR